MASAATLATAASVTATVRVARFAACTALLDVTPVATFTEHCSYAFSVAVAAVKVTAALAVPPFASATVNVVVPHPLTARPPTVLRPNVGSVSAMESLTFSGTFNANVYEIDDGASVTAVMTVDDGVFRTVSSLCFNAGVGAATAVELGIATAATFVAVASVTAAVRVFRFAFCAPALVVARVAALVLTPVAIVTMHCVLAASVAVAAVNVTVAVAVPELVPATVNVVVPHPLVVGVTKVPSVNVGSTNATLSLAFIAAFSSNVYAIDDAAHVTGLAMASTL